MANSSRKHAKKSKSMSRKSPIKKMISGSMKYDNMDVKTLEDVSKLIQHIKNNVVTLLLIYADWCGHCGTFKKDIWSKLSATKGRKMSMAQINEKVLHHLKEAIPDLKTDGYPSVALVGKDMKAAEITDPTTGEKGNSLPNTRDMAAMTQLVKANPSQVIADKKMSVKKEPVELEEPKSATPTPESLKSRKQAGKEAIENMNNGISNITPEMSSVSPNPPNVEDDLVSSDDSAAVAPSSKPHKKTPPAVGGSLYAALLAATQKTVVPALLTTAAVALTKRRGKSHALRSRKRK